MIVEVGNHNRRLESSYRSHHPSGSVKIIYSVSQTSGRCRLGGKLIQM